MHLLDLNAWRTFLQVKSLIVFFLINFYLKHFQGTNLLVQNLGRSIDDSELKYLFSSFGTITSAKVSLLLPYRENIG